MLKPSGFHKKSKGAVLVEFAIILPFLLIIIAGVLVLSLFLIQDNTLNKSVRESSRYVADNLGVQGCYTNIATDLIAANMNTLFSSSYADFTGSTPTIEQICVDESTGIITGSPVTIGASCAITGIMCSPPNHLHIRVQASYNAAMVIPGLMGFNFAPTLSATSIMRVQ